MRRSHRKSRNGCTQCKHRHIKCNEVKPQCGNCQRLDIACSFAPSTASPRPDTLVSSLSTPIGTPPILSPATQPLSILDLELYHHFVYHYSHSLITNTHARNEVFENVLELGLSHDFLMHNFLALSALHLYQKDRSRSELFERACYLQGVAIQYVQPVIANLGQDDALAALLFSGHTAAFGLAEFMLNPQHDHVDPIDKIIECFQLSRGIKVIVSPYWSYLKDTWLSALFPRPEDEEEKARASVASAFPTYSMVRSLAFGQEDTERRQCCLQAVEDIFTYISVTTNHREKYATSTHLVDAWVVQLPTPLKDMMVERKPIALIILAYWAVMTSINPRPWHLKGLAEVLIARIEIILGTDWSEFLRWPKEKIMENVRAAPDTPGTTSNVDTQLESMRLSHESSFAHSTTGAQLSQPSPYITASNHPSPYHQASNHASPYGTPSNHPSPYNAPSSHPSPYNPASNQPSPYSQGPPTG